MNKTIGCLFTVSLLLLVGCSKHDQKNVPHRENGPEPSPINLVVVPGVSNNLTIEGLDYTVTATPSTNGFRVLIATDRKSGPEDVSSGVPLGTVLKETRTMHLLPDSKASMLLGHTEVLLTVKVKEP